MFKLARTSPTVALGFAVVLAGGCASRPPRDNYRPAETTTGEPLQGRPELAMPITLVGRDACLVPLTMENTKGWFEDKDPYTRGGAYASASLVRYAADPSYVPLGGPVRWHNVLFRDLRTGDQWALLGRRGAVSAWHQFGPRNERGELTEAQMLVFIVTQRDSNGDGVLNDNDERVAVVTDGSGRGPREVTPQGAQVWSATYEPSHGVAYFLVVADTNGDGTIDHTDEPAPFMLAATSAGAAEPVIEPALVQRATGLLR